jgi:hypothetical protein
VTEDRPWHGIDGIQSVAQCFEQLRRLPPGFVGARLRSFQRKMPCWQYSDVRARNSGSARQDAVAVGTKPLPAVV